MARLDHAFLGTLHHPGEGFGGFGLELLFGHLKMSAKVARISLGFWKCWILLGLIHVYISFINSSSSNLIAL